MSKIRNFSSRDRSYANSGGAIDFPDAPDTLGNLEKVDHPRIKTIASYLNAGWNNAQDGTWLRPEANALLYKVVDSLPEPWGLCVFDAWRPLDLQAELFNAAYKDPNLPEGFVSPADRKPDFALLTYLVGQLTVASHFTESLSD